MGLTDEQRAFADEHVGEDIATEPLHGRIVGWWDAGADNALLLCRGVDGPFTKLLHLPPGEKELARRAAEQSVLDEEAFAAREADQAVAVEAQQAAAREAFGRQLADWAQVDPEDPKAMALLHERVAGLLQ